MWAELKLSDFLLRAEGRDEWPFKSRFPPSLWKMQSHCCSKEKEMYSVFWGNESVSLLCNSVGYKALYIIIYFLIQGQRSSVFCFSTGAHLWNSLTCARIQWRRGTFWKSCTIRSEEKLQCRQRSSSSNGLGYENEAQQASISCRHCGNSRIWPTLTGWVCNVSLQMHHKWEKPSEHQIHL